VCVCVCVQVNTASKLNCENYCTKSEKFSNRYLDRFFFVTVFSFDKEDMLFTTQ